MDLTNHSITSTDSWDLELGAHTCSERLLSQGKPHVDNELHTYDENECVFLETSD
jgi:hypothetical protein